MIKLMIVGLIAAGVFGGVGLIEIIKLLFRALRRAKHKHDINVSSKKSEMKRIKDLYKQAKKEVK